MSAYDVVQFDGTPLGAGTDYDARLDPRDQYVMTGTVDSIQRRSAAPLVTGTASEGRTLTLWLNNAAGSSLTAAQFRDAVKALFDPRLNSAGERILVIESDDGTTDVQTGCYVMQWEYLSQGVDQYVVTLWSPSGIWQATSLTTSASNPATVTNAGNTVAYPTIELTTGTHVTRRACTVTGAGAGGGLIAYPVVFALADTAATDTNTFVYVEGVSVPCWVDDSGGATSRVWALIDTASDGTTATNVDIIYGTGLTNPLCQTLSDGGMDWADNTNTTNTAWSWDDWATVSSNPARAGVWRPALTGNHNDASNATYAITTESTSSLVISLGAAGTYDNSADSIRLHVGATGTTFAAIRRITAGLDGTNARAYIRYRVPGSSAWVDAWTSTTNATVTTGLALPGAVEIAIGIENFGGTADPATFNLAPTTDVSLVLTNAPTVVVGSATNMDRYNGTYTIGSRSITFSNLLVPDGTLTINTETRSITSSVAGPFYGGEDALLFSSPDIWLALLPGSNTVTDGLSATDTIQFRSAFT